MKRREVLATAAALSTAGLAGCITGTGDGPTDEEPTDATTVPGDDGTTPAGETTGEGATSGTATDDSPEGTSGDGDSPDGTTTGGDESGGTDGTGTPDQAGGTPTGDGGPTERSFEVTGADCASDASDEASVSFEDGRLAVEGVVPGDNGCYAARLASADYDADADELAVTVEAYQEGEGVCTQCLVAVEYRASFLFDGGVPGTVVVRHRDEGSGDARTVTEASP